MSVPADLMSLVAGGGKPPGTPSPAPGGGSPPAGGPMTQPAKMEGLQTAALVDVAMVFQLLEKSLAAFGSPTDKGKAILSALKTLTSAFGKDRQQAGELVPAELAQLVQSIPNPTGKAMNAMPPTQSAVPQGAQ